MRSARGPGRWEVETPLAGPNKSLRLPAGRAGASPASKRPSAEPPGSRTRGLPRSPGHRCTQVPRAPAWGEGGNPEAPGERERASGPVPSAGVCLPSLTPTGITQARTIRTASGDQAWEVFTDRAVDKRAFRRMWGEPKLTAGACETWIIARTELCIRAPRKRRLSPAQREATRVAGRRLAAQRWAPAPPQSQPADLSDHLAQDTAPPPAEGP